MTTYRKSYMGFLKKLIIGPLKSKMAEIRHLENRHDIIFSAEGDQMWLKFRRLVQNDMSIADCGDKVEIETRCRIPICLGEFSGMSSQSHLPHNSIRHIENRFSPVFLSFFRFLMQFGLWRATPFVSSPIYLLTKPRLLPHCYGPQCINNVLIGYDIATRHFALHCRHELQYQSLYDAEYVISNLSKIKVKVKVKVSVFI